MTGYLLPRLQIPWWWRWVHYGVPLPYTFQIATSIQLYCEDAAPAAAGLASWGRPHFRLRSLQLLHQMTPPPRLRFMVN